jgi:hypothetical protein
MNARYRAHQIARLFEFVSTQLHIELSARAVARAFEVSHTKVARAELRRYDDPPVHRHHRELSADCEQELVQWLANKAANHRAVNRTKLSHEFTERFGKSMTRGWVNSFITRHAHKLFETKAPRKKIQGLKCLAFSLKRQSMDSETLFTIRALNSCLAETKLVLANGKIAVSGGSSFCRR